eukprot:g39377.t1
MGTPSTKGTSEKEGAACKSSDIHCSGGGGGGAEGFVVSPSQQRASKAASTLNVKKARLLQAEACDGAKRRRVCGHGLQSNDQEGTAKQGELGKAQQQQHSTLLASLLQSFSSRLQNVALSQQAGAPRLSQAPSLGSPPEDDLRSYGLVSNHLRALLKNREPSQSEHLPKEPDGLYQSPAERPRFPSSPADHQGAAEPISCSARLRAVASMVENGARSNGSPKPSVACSQLALLLSSDTQLQQYTREHSLGARAPHPSASQRLAAIANQKVAEPSSPRDPARDHCSKDGHRRGASRGNPGVPEQSLRLAGHTRSPSGTREKSVGERDRSPLGPNNSSSLLMHLLNTNSIPKSSADASTETTNGHRWLGAERRGGPAFDYRLPAWEKPVKQEAGSLEETYSSDESSRSSCTPMDLSTKPRMCEPISLHSRSLEQMTESLLFSWNPKGPRVQSPEAKEDRNGPESKSHQKVTLLQLLLGHQNGARGNCTPEPQAPELKTERPSSIVTTPEASVAGIALSQRPRGPEHFPPSSSASSSSSSSSSSLSSSFQAAEQSAVVKVTRSPPAPAAHRLPPLCHASDGTHHLLARRGKLASSSEPSKTLQHFPQQLEAAKGHRALEPLLPSELAKAHQFPKHFASTELATNSQYVSRQPLTSESRLSNFSFSASKLLQDLAHTGFHKSPETSQADAEDKNVVLSSVETRMGESAESLTFSRSAKQSVLLEPRARRDRRPLQPGPVPSSDLESLLERRSVLQLLLKTPKKDKVPTATLHGRPGDHQTLAGPQPPGTQCNGQAADTEPISMVKVKTEPIEEEGGFPSTAEPMDQSANCQPLVPSKTEQKHPSFTLGSVKQEVASPAVPSSRAQCHPCQKGGVLSQLLQRDNTATLGSYAFSQHPAAGNLAEAPTPTSGSSSPCNIPKKRKPPPTPPSELDDLHKMVDQSEGLNSHDLPSREAANGLSSSPACGTRLLDFQPGNGLEFESRSNVKDPQGFNVLKQLLLSENGIKVLPGHRTLHNGSSASDRGSRPDRRLEGDRPTRFYSPSEQLNGNQNETVSAFEPARYLGILPAAGSSAHYAAENPASATVPAQSEPEHQAPSLGMPTEPPWLTKTNPILYYMLQRGGLGLVPSRARAGEGGAAEADRRRKPPPRQRAEQLGGGVGVLPSRRTVKAEPGEDSLAGLQGLAPGVPPDLNENARGILEK